MGRGDPAGIHFHAFWVDRAKDPALPLWLRIVGYAYGSHAKNGHATFYLVGQSTLPDVLEKSRRHVQNELRNAVAYGFLAPESTINCLVLPSEICGGAEGNAYAECKLHAS